MGKLVPYWGNHLGLVAPTIFKTLTMMCVVLSIMPPIWLLYIYLMRELVQKIQTTHFPTSLQVYQILCIAWLHLFLDNASSTNKNCFTMAWAMEIVQQGKLDFIRVTFIHNIWSYQICS